MVKEVNKKFPVDTIYVRTDDREAYNKMLNHFTDGGEKSSFIVKATLKAFKRLVGKK